MALGLYLGGEMGADPVAATNSPEVQELSRQSVHAWVGAIEASDTATAEEIATMSAMVMEQWAPDSAPLPDNYHRFLDPIVLIDRRGVAA